MPFRIVRDDIVHADLEAVVCPNGEDLVPQGSVSAAIFAVAGKRLMRECRKLGSCPVGGAVITRGHDLKAEYVIHTVPPVWQGGGQGEEHLLRSCYRSSLMLAQERGIASVAFPLIGAGTGGVPRALALQVATEEIGAFLLEYEEIHVQLLIFDQDTFLAGKSIFREIDSYVDEHYVAEHAAPQNRDALRAAMERAGVTKSPLLMDMPVVVRPTLQREPPAFCPVCQQPTRKSARFCGKCGANLSEDVIPTGKKPVAMDTADLFSHSDADVCADGNILEEKAPRSAQKLWPMEPEQAATGNTLEMRLQHLSDTFSTYLLHLIDMSGQTDAQVYKKANIDRRLFSKIRSNPDYQPKKTTALALALALELNLDDTRDLLQRAGYALSPASQFDLIVSYYIERGVYNVFKINEALFFYNQQLLGA